MKVREKKWIRFRIYLVSLFFLGGLGLILARAYQLQVLEKDRLASIALSGYKDVVKLPPKRGTIYDREGHELAVTVEVESIYAHPKLVKEKRSTARALSKILQTKESKILSNLKSKSPFVWIDRRTTPEKTAKVKALALAGIGFTKESGRYYPGREIASHLLGFAGTDNQGLEGLEKAYDHVLRGPECTLTQMRDALGRPFYVSRPMADGHEMHDLVLTIDKDVQYKAQQALQAVVKETKAKSGQCVIVDPMTGEILALAVCPNFNPNVFWKHQPSQWRNRAVTDCYEPGSTIKAFLLAAAFDKGVVSPQMTFFCEEGKYRVGNHTIHDHDAEGHGLLTVSEIITFSSNIGAVKIGERLGYKRFYEYLRRFGFGEKTGIDLIGERQGFVRPEKEAKEIDKANLYFGQGMAASSIQLVMAMAAIANGGKLMRPFVVKSIKNQGGQVVRETRPKVVRRVVSPETARRTARILEKVAGEDGTGSLAAIEGHRVAGKTGTSQKVDPRTKTYSKEHYVSLFVGFVPVGHPKLTMLIMVDEPQEKKYGGLVAAPVFKEVGAWSLSHYQVTPQLILVKRGEKGERHVTKNARRALEPEVREVNPDILPDFKGQTMREALTEARALGVKVVLEGTGLAVKQTPKPGCALSQVEIVKISFRPPM
jgi:cell division protein FtsI (penicillin-binding protein 3)